MTGWIAVLERLTEALRGQTPRLPRRDTEGERLREGLYEGAG